MDDVFSAIFDALGPMDVASPDAGPMLHTHDNVMGGYDTFEHGQLVDHAVPNVLGGFNHFDAHGSMHASSHDNILGGVDLADASGQLLLHTQPNVLGGLTVTEPGGCQVADALSDPFGFHARFFK